MLMLKTGKYIKERKRRERERKRKEEEEGKKRKENYSFINTGTKMAYKILANRISLNMIEKKSLEKNQSVQFSSVTQSCPTLFDPRNQSTPGLPVLILPLHAVHGVLKARILKWFAIPFSSGPHSVRPLIMTCPSWVAPHGMT